MTKDEIGMTSGALSLAKIGTLNILALTIFLFWAQAQFTGAPHWVALVLGIYQAFLLVLMFFVEAGFQIAIKLAARK